MNRVIRPGLFQWIYIMLAPAFCGGLGIFAIAYGFTSKAPDWGSRLPAGLALIAVGLFIAAYFVGTWIELSDESVTKVRLFGRWRTAIPIAELTTSRERLGRDTTVIRFSTRGGSTSFALYKLWVWRERDVDELMALAHQHR